MCLNIYVTHINTVGLMLAQALGGDAVIGIEVENTSKSERCYYEQALKLEGNQA